MLKNNFEFEVLVNGKSVAEYLHDGEIFIEGKEGTEFSLRLRNNSGNRALFVPTIDGLSVMDGKEASYKSSGYIVHSYSAETIDGWRTSDKEVARFFFAKIKDSYAAKSGKSGNQGVIGCAVFEENRQEPIVIKEYIREKEYVPYPTHGWDCQCWKCRNQQQWNNIGNGILRGSSLGGQLLSASSQAMNCSSSVEMLSASNSLGTGFGDAKHAPVVTVEFDQKSSPVAVFVIRYNTRTNLEAMGVQFKKPVYASASPFPKESAYCEPPKDWRRSK